MKEIYNDTYWCNYWNCLCNQVKKVWGEVPCDMACNTCKDLEIVEDGCKGDSK